MSKIDSVEDLFILLGSNLRLESAVLNSRIRFRYKNSLINIQAMGVVFEENIPTSFVNLSLSKAIEVFEGKSSILSRLLVSSKKPFIIIGENFSDRIDNVNSFIRTLSTLLPSSNIFYLNNSCNSRGIENLNLSKYSSRKNKASIAVNLDDSTFTRKIVSNLNRKIWINTHGSYLATKFDMIVPSLTSFETEQVYINAENRPQKTQKSFVSFFNVKSLKDIVMAIFNTNLTVLNSKENYLSHIKEMLENGEKYSSLKTISSPFESIKYSFAKYNNPVQISKYPVKQKIKDFYCTDTFTRNSIIMQECSSEVIKNSVNFYKN